MFKTETKMITDNSPLQILRKIAYKITPEKKEEVGHKQCCADRHLTACSP
jgi:hypothetical protein